MKIYVASSWRNRHQPQVVQLLRRAGHGVYDFRNPAPGHHGFSWSEIDPEWENWTPEQYRRALKHPVAQAGYASDSGAIDWCDTGVLVLPSGRSASWELGFIMGQGKPGVVYMPEPFEPELMYSKARIIVSVSELARWANERTVSRDQR